MMNKNIALVPARYYIRLWDILLSRHIVMDEAAYDFKSDMSKFQKDPELKFSIHQVEQIIQACLSMPHCEDLAFELGKSLHLSAHNLVGYAVLTCDTLEHAIKLVTQYFSLIMPSFRASIYYTKTGDIELFIEPVALMDSLTLNFHIEAIAIALYQNIRELLNQQRCRYSFFLSIHTPAYIRKFEELDNVKFYFNALDKPSLKVALPQEMLNYPLPLADEITLRTVERRCQEQMKEITHRHDFPEWIKMVLMNAYHIPTLSECAELLNISTKTLQRQLRKQNIDFNNIRKDVLLSRATQKLNHSSDSITQIAYELGYSSSSNFSRAFKILQGMTPEEYREQSGRKYHSSKV